MDRKNFFQRIGERSRYYILAYWVLTHSSSLSGVMTVVDAQQHHPSHILGYLRELHPSTLQSGISVSLIIKNTEFHN